MCNHKIFAAFLCVNWLCLTAICLTTQFLWYPLWIEMLFLGVWMVGTILLPIIMLYLLWEFPTPEMKMARVRQYL
jgi:hypothetical protein